MIVAIASDPAEANAPESIPAVTTDPSP